eukprot:g20968.t1
MPNFLRRLRKRSVLVPPNCYIYVESPGQVIGYCHSEELDALHPVNLSSIDVDGGVFSSFISKLYDQSFSFPDVERQIVFIAPCHQALYLPSVFCLIIVRYPSHYGGKLLEKLSRPGTIGEENIRVNVSGPVTLPHGRLLQKTKCHGIHRGL